MVPPAIRTFQVRVTTDPLILSWSDYIFASIIRRAVFRLEGVLEVQLVSTTPAPDPPDD